MKCMLHKKGVSVVLNNWWMIRTTCILEECIKIKGSKPAFKWEKWFNYYINKFTTMTVLIKCYIYLYKEIVYSDLQSKERQH